MTTAPEIYPIWTIEEGKQVNSTRDVKKYKEITQIFRIKINGFRQSQTKRLRSPDLHFKHQNSQSIWYLTLEPKVKPIGCSHYYFGLFLHLKGKSFERLSGQIAKFQISVFNTKSGKILTKTSGKLYFSYGSGWGWKCFIEKDQIFGSSKRSLDLNLLISITLLQSKNLDQSQDLQELCSGDYHRCDRFAFNHDFMNDREYCDIKFVVEDMDFEVHSRLLAAKSSVFKNMFAKEREICVRELDALVFYEMISFLYKGYSTNIEKYCKQLLIAANSYQISHLKSVCDNLCFRDLRPEEAIDALVFAIKYQTFSARIRTLCYIALNLNQVIESSEEKWKDFESNNRVLVQQIREISKMKCQCIQH